MSNTIVEAFNELTEAFNELTKSLEIVTKSLEIFKYSKGGYQPQWKYSRKKLQKHFILNLPRRYRMYGYKIVC